MMTRSGGWFHMCGREGIEQFAEALQRVWDIAARLLPQAEWTPRSPKTG